MREEARELLAALGIGDDAGTRTDDLPYDSSQYLTLAVLTKALCSAYPAISIDRIVGHADIAPGRKTDPGPAFDWPRYRNALR